MDLALTDDQRLLAETARAFVTRSCPLSVARAQEATDAGVDAALWATAGRLGWTGLCLPPESGGSGQGLFEFVVLCAELGRGLFPSPLIPSTTTVALPIAWEGDAIQRGRWLPGLAAGTLTATLALLEPGARDEWDDARLTVKRASDVGLALQGTKTMVPFADAVDLLLVAGRLDDRPALVLVDRRSPGVRCTRLHTLGGDPLYDVSFDGVRVTGADVLAGDRTVFGCTVLDRALDHAAVASLAYITGAAERALEMTVAHAKAREQFGRPIGAFQAVAHRCVDMRVDIDACRYLAYQAAWALDAGRSAELEVAAAKAYGNDALRRVFMHAHQVHGAVGFSTEHDLQLLSRRAKAFELTYGSTARQRERVAVAMGL